MQNHQFFGEQREDTSKQTTWKRSGLSLRMTMSYVFISVVAVLLLEFLAGLVAFWLLVYGPLDDTEHLSQARQTAQIYAMMASLQGNGAQLNPHSTFLPGQTASLTLNTVQVPDLAQYSVPYTDTPSSDTQNVEVVLLVEPDGRVLASSYPARYPVSTSVTHLLPQQSRLIAEALAGRAGSMVEVTSQGRVKNAAAPIWSSDKRPLGAMYVQLPPDITLEHFFFSFLKGWFKSGLGLLAITVPIGLFFGTMTTRPLIRRIQYLTTATTRIADGEYTQRVPITRKDEVGQLELQFNRMAQQLVESIEAEQILTQQHARLQERTRIARELHDSVKQQLFALSLQIGAALSLPEHKREKAQLYLKEADDLASQAQQELTALIWELRPSLLRDKGLGVALQDYLVMWSRQNTITTEVQIPEACVLPQALEEALWRVAQEALANVARHSQASSVQVKLECHQETVRLSLMDNGCGFDPAEREQSGIGLHSMRERMEALGGTLTIQSEGGQGTHITAQCVNNRLLLLNGAVREKEEADGRAY
jgi:NarL family two-component system sensor histidine kinase LiaS